MTSKVFKALFSSKYAEGQTSEVCLKDPPAPMALMCRLLHHQHYHPIPSKSELLDFAILVDKYDCVEALRLPVFAMLTEYVERPVDNRVDHLITASYLLDQPLHFRHFTKDLVMHETLIRRDRCEARCLELLPAHLMMSALAQQTVACHALTRQITELVHSLSAAAYEAEKPTFTYEFMRTYNAMGFGQ